MRRLPIFFILDCSESMVGENLQKMNAGLQAIVSDLRKDPHALETAWISVIAFAGVAKTLVPLIDVAAFYPPRLPVGSGTCLGAALRELIQQIDLQVRKTTVESKGDWKPLVYLLTDGRPTDDISAEISRWKTDYAHRVNLMAIGIGAAADLHILRQLTDNVMLFNEQQEQDFTQFIQWISASVSAHSRSIGEPATATPALPETGSLVRLAKEDVARASDETCVVLTGRCSRSRRPYLMKYERPAVNLASLDFKLNIHGFNLAGCYPIEEDYFAWSDHSASALQVNTAELHGVPGCPHCGNGSAFALCTCGKLLCVGGPDDVICPWCSKGLSFSEGAGDDFDVNRGRG